MIVYDKAYMELRNKYIVPLSAYSVPYTSLKKTNVKSILLQKWTSVSVLNNQYVFTFEKTDLYKGLLGDIELFFIRHLIQQNDVKVCSNPELSANWNIVTNYYNAFFTASLMLRLCHRGNIFLDTSLKQSIEKLISSVTGNVVHLDSNQFFEANIAVGSSISLSSCGKDGTHELVWKKMDALLNEMLLLSRPKSDEAEILKVLIEINQQLTNTFPSILRNRVNYQPIYGMQYLDRKLFFLNNEISWVKTLLGATKTDDDNQIAIYMLAYAKYMEHFCTNLIIEYYTMRGIDNGILKKYNKNRDRKTELGSAVYSF